MAILRYYRGPYTPITQAPTYDFGIPQGVVSTIIKRVDFVLGWLCIGMKVGMIVEINQFFKMEKVSKSALF